MNKKSEKDNQILDAASKEFISKGLDAASMQNIAELAEVSKRTLYKYYSNKDELFNALIDTILDEVESSTRLKYDSNQSLEMQLKQIVDNKFSLVTSPNFLRVSRILFGEMLKGKTPTSSQLERMYKSEAQFLKWIEDACKAGSIHSKLSSQTIADQFNSFVKGQIYWPVLIRLKNASDLNKTEIVNQCVVYFQKMYC